MRSEGARGRGLSALSRCFKGVDRGASHPVSNSHCCFGIFFHSRHFHFHPISTQQRHQRSRTNCRRTRPRPHSEYHFHPCCPVRIRQLISNSCHCHPWRTIIASIAPASRAWNIHHCGTSTAASRRNSSSKSPVEIVTKSPVIPDPTPRQSWAAFANCRCRPLRHC